MSDYTGFRFGKYHTDDLNLIVTSSSDRYKKTLLPSIKDYTVAIPSGNGNYYFGSTFGNQEFSVNVAFDNISEDNWRLISKIFGNDKLQDLVFDELPYKTYKAKIKTVPDFKFVYFVNEETQERVYKGEGSINFVCYQPFAYAFNKYIVRTADYYKHNTPEDAIREWYNTEKNKKYWLGGYPTIEQVQNGELFFNTDKETHCLIDVRNYWDNVPQWAHSSKLLTTPTLDYDRELIFMPQVSKIDYYNMDKGFERDLDHTVCSNRLLVYNPGDIPIEFTLKFNNLKRTFGRMGTNRFRIRRLNVQRLNIEDAIDWLGLTTNQIQNNTKYKYGNKYFQLLNQKATQDKILDSYSLDTSLSFDDLEQCHPKHCYMIEPIPRERLGYYIRNFYHQSSGKTQSVDKFEEKGNEIATKYEEDLANCIDEREEYELYWDTLKTHLLSAYQYAMQFKGLHLTIDQFIQSFLTTIPEYFISSEDKNYDEIDFNTLVLPQYYTDDFLEFHVDDTLENDLILDTENRMLYHYEDKINTYKYSPQKQIFNDYIDKGQWFKLPTGWSVIEIVPVIDSEATIGKTWCDARNFDWGYSSDKLGEENAHEVRNLFRHCYNLAKKYFLKTYKEQHPELKDMLKDTSIYEEKTSNENFRHWLVDWRTSTNTLVRQMYYRITNSIELEFLQTIQKYWSCLQGHKINDIIIEGSIDEWWWYACNYIWDNFPPIYWGYAALLNKATIEYTPLYY